MLAHRNGKLRSHFEEGSSRKPSYGRKVHFTLQSLCGSEGNSKKEKLQLRVEAISADSISLVALTSKSLVRSSLQIGFEMSYLTW